MSDVSAVIRTNKGDINLRLFADKTPVTVANFVNLANHGFYDGLSFYRVIEGFVAQAGPGADIPLDEDDLLDAEGYQELLEEEGA